MHRLFRLPAVIMTVVVMSAMFLASPARADYDWYYGNSYGYPYGYYGYHHPRHARYRATFLPRPSHILPPRIVYAPQIIPQRDPQVIYVRPSEVVVVRPQFQYVQDGSMGRPHKYNDDYCREYTEHVDIGGRLTESYGTACLEPDGSWHIRERR